MTCRKALLFASCDVYLVFRHAGRLCAPTPRVGYTVVLTQVIQGCFKYYKFIFVCLFYYDLFLFVYCYCTALHAKKRLVCNFPFHPLGGGVGSSLQTCCSPGLQANETPRLLELHICIAGEFALDYILV